MPCDLSHHVHAFGGKRVLLIGDLILDRYVYGDAERISPEAPVPVLRVVETRDAVGGSGNVAACLRALGCNVVCCGVMGNDAHGQTLRRLLDALGVDCAGVTVQDDRPTTAKTRMVGLAQHRHRQQLLRVDEENASPLSDAGAQALVEAAVKLIDACDVVCIEDYDKGVVTNATAQAIIAAATRAHKPVLVDPARLRDYERYRGSTAITPNREELSIALGRRFASIDEVAGGAKSLLAAFDLRAVIATVDRDGAVVVERDKAPRHLPTVPRSVYDNTGAGDAVLAMLAASIAAGAGFVDAARLANIAGGLEVEKFGCVPIAADEVLAELRLEDRDRNGKLRSVDEVVAEISLRRDRGETCVFTNGCFDILHAGHVDYLKRARQLGSMLVLGLNTDASVRSLDKGTDRPLNPFEDRAAVLSALACVDYIVGFEEDTPLKLIQSVRPDVLVKGEDWAGKGVVGADFVEKNGGRVVLVPLLEGRSTTNLIERIRGGA